MFVIGNTWLWFITRQCFLVLTVCFFASGPSTCFKEIGQRCWNQACSSGWSTSRGLRRLPGRWYNLSGGIQLPCNWKDTENSSKSNARYILYCYHQGRKHSYWESCQVWQWCCCCYNCWSRRVFERWHPGCPPGGTEWLPLAGIRSVDHSFETRSSPQIPWERKPTPSFFERQTIPK